MKPSLATRIVVWLMVHPYSTNAAIAKGIGAPIMSVSDMTRRLVKSGQLGRNRTHGISARGEAFWHYYLLKD